MDESIEKEYKRIIKEYELVILKVCSLYQTKEVPFEDLKQEVLINIWKGFKNFRHECKISTWIYRIAFNTCITSIRKSKKMQIVSTGIPEELESYQVNEEDAKLEMIRKMYKMISCLNNLDKSIIMLYLEDKNYEEISEIIGISPTNVGTKISRIKKKLKEMKPSVE